jgi:hypothetical protein
VARARVCASASAGFRAAGYVSQRAGRMAVTGGRAVAYRRVSTSDQADSGLGRVGAADGNRNGPLRVSARLVETFTDAGVSGGPLSNIGPPWSRQSMRSVQATCCWSPNAIDLGAMC